MIFLVGGLQKHSNTQPDMTGCRVTKAYYRVVKVSIMIGYSECPFVVSAVIHVRDLSLFSVVMKGLRVCEGDYNFN